MRNLYETLVSEKANKTSGGIYHNFQIDFAYNSNHIEGSRLTHDQTRYIFETHQIEGEGLLINDIIETVNHFKCFDYILDTASSTLSEEYIKDLHFILKNGIMAGDDAVIGDYKRFPNSVGEIKTATPKSVSKKMEELLSTYENPQKTLYDIVAFHADFEKIHPFYDGNGRVGRLIMLKQCFENNIVPFYITEFHKMYYYKGLKEWQTEGKKERLIDVCLSAQDNVKNLLDYFEIDYDKTFVKCKDILEQSEKKQGTNDSNDEFLR